MIGSGLFIFLAFSIAAWPACAGQGKVIRVQEFRMPLGQSGVDGRAKALEDTAALGARDTQVLPIQFEPALLQEPTPDLPAPQAAQAHIAQPVTAISAVDQKQGLPATTQENQDGPILIPTVGTERLRGEMREMAAKPAQAVLQGGDRMSAEQAHDVASAMDGTSQSLPEGPVSPVAPEIIQEAQIMLWNSTLVDVREKFGQEVLDQTLLSMRLATLGGHLHSRSFGPPWEREKAEDILTSIAELVGLPVHDLDHVAELFRRFLDAEDLKGTATYWSQSHTRRDLTVAQMAAELRRQGKIQTASSEETLDAGKRSPYGGYSEKLVTHQALRAFTGLSMPRGIPTRQLGHGSYWAKGGMTYQQEVMWVRDYFPLLRFMPRRSPDGVLYQPQIIQYTYPFSPDGRPFTAEFPNTPLGHLPVEVRSLALMIRGGDFVWTQGTPEEPGYFITSEHTVMLNARSHDELLLETHAMLLTEAEHFQRPIRLSGEAWVWNYYASNPGLGPSNVRRSREQVIDELAAAARVPRDRVIITPWLPGSKTGDVDEYIAPLTGNTVAVAEIVPESIETRSMSHERDYAYGLNAWLEARAREFRSRGLKIERIPMFAPVNLKPNEFGGWNPDFLPTINWSRLNNHVLAPDFSDYLIRQSHPPELVRKLQKHIEIRTREVLARYSMSVEFMNIRGLAEINGLGQGPNGCLHCVSGVECCVKSRAQP